MSAAWRLQEGDTPLHILTRAVDKEPDATFLEFEDARSVLTYGAMWERITSVAGGLLAMGLQPGDRVATMLDNNVDCVASWFAIGLVGGISVPLNTAYKGQFLLHQLSDSGSGVAIVEHQYAERFLRVAPSLPDSFRLVVRGAKAEMHAAIECRSFEDCLIEDQRDRFDVRVTPGGINSIFYTGGTTGPSKGCIISHNQVCELAKKALEVQGRAPDERIWTPLPLFHLNAVTQGVLASALVGGSASISNRFSVSNFWPEILRSHARIVSLLGSMVTMIAQMETTPELEAAHGQLRVAWAAPFPEAAQRVWRDRFGVVDVGCSGYGMTETGYVLSAPLAAGIPPASSGRANDNFDVLVVDDDDRPLPPGEAGELVVRPLAPHVMFEGYWNRPAETLRTMSNLWFHTGDIGKFDEEGWFYFLDRKKDYLRRRGENISSFEVEVSVAGHPAVEQAAAVSVPSPFSEDDLMVFVKLIAGATIDERELFDWLVDEMPYFAVPRYIEFVDELPMSPLGRVLKFELRERGVGERTWDAAAAGLSPPSR